MAAISVKEDGTGDYTTLEDAVENASTQDGDVITISGTWPSNGSKRENTRITVADSVTIIATGDSRHPGRPWRSGDTHYQHRSTSSGHSFTLTDSGTFDLDGVDIILDHTGVSDEIFRANISVSSTITNCLLGFATRTSEQDVYYTDNSEVDVTFEQCMFYNVFRGVVDMTSSAFGVVNINSCTAYDIGFSDSETSRSGLVGKNTSGTTTINIYNTIVHMNEVGFPVCTNSTTANTTANIERLITNSSQAPMDSAPATSNYANNVVTATINDTDSSGNYILIDTTTSPYDLRLFDNATNNAAQDVHADATKANLTIPTTDIVGTSRPQNTNFDIGAFEVEAAGGDTNVNVSTEALTITEQAATISLDINVAANVEALTITEFAATIDLDVNIAASTEALVITENVASITLDVAVNVATESLTITSFQAVVDVSGTTEVIVNTESLVLTPNQATIQVGLNTEIAASVEALVLTGQQASIGIDVDVIANTESLVLTTNAAAIQVGTNILASVASLVITENAATITKNIEVNASTESLVMTPLSATVVSSGATTLSAQDVINIVDAIFAHVVENSETFNQQLRLIRAEAAGKLAVVGTTVTLRDSADTKDRITATVDNDGQRTSITTDVS